MQSPCWSSKPSTHATALGDFGRRRSRMRPNSVTSARCASLAATAARVTLDPCGGGGSRVPAVQRSERPRTRSMSVYGSAISLSQHSPRFSPQAAKSQYTHTVHRLFLRHSSQHFAADGSF